MKKIILLFSFFFIISCQETKKVEESVKLSPTAEEKAASGKAAEENTPEPAVKPSSEGETQPAEGETQPAENGQSCTCSCESKNPKSEESENPNPENPAK